MVLRDFSKDHDPEVDPGKPRVRVFCGDVGVGKTHTIAPRSESNRDTGPLHSAMIQCRCDT